MDKEQLAIARLQDAARLSEHRYKKPLMVTYSGGKDSQVLVALAERAGINFEVVNSHTTADAPETVYFIREQFKAMEEHGIKCSIVIPRYKDKPVSMWTLIPQKLMPPTRLVRYCCAVLKENTGRDRFIATGVRWAESARRKNSRGVMELMHKDPAKRIILMGDNDEKRQLFETCSIKGKMTVNPIVDWSDDDVWDYTHSEHLPINPLYCEGQKRVGCIGCPMAGRGGRQREFMRWPAYEKMYISAFGRMLDVRKAKGLPCDWQTGMDVFRWWMEDDNINGQLSIFDFEFPTDFGNDEDVDTVAAAAPFILVKAAGWSIDKMEEPELVDMSLIICTYQTPSRNKAEGARDMKAPAVLDLYNIMQDLAQHFRVYNVFGDYFNVLLPIDCAIQQDNTSPYYFATVQMDVTCPSMSSENNPEIEVLI